MSTSGRTNNYYACVVRQRMLAAAHACLDAALNTVFTDDSGTAIRIQEMRARCEDEANVAQEALDRAAKEL